MQFAFLEVPAAWPCDSMDVKPHHVKVLVLFPTGLPDGDVHHVQGSHREERVCSRLDGHDHDAEQVQG